MMKEGRSKEGRMEEGMKEGMEDDWLSITDNFIHASDMLPKSRSYRNSVEMLSVF